VAQGRAPQVSLDDGWWAVAIGMAAQMSASTGQAVAGEALRSLAPPHPA
jgi:hypothetical protein